MTEFANKVFVNAHQKAWEKAVAKAPELDVNKLIRISADFVLGKKDIKDIVKDLSDDYGPAVEQYLKSITEQAIKNALKESNEETLQKLAKGTFGKVSEGLSNFTGDNGYSSYSEIYEDYKKKLQDATPTLIEEYKAEVANNTKGLEGRAEIANAKVQKLAEIETEGTQKMAEFMYSKGSGKYEEYSEWAGKLYEIYNEEGTEIYNVYLYDN